MAAQGSCGCTDIERHGAFCVVGSGSFVGARVHAGSSGGDPKGRSWKMAAVLSCNVQAS